jgi:hypothetical protein
MGSATVFNIIHLLFYCFINLGIISNRMRQISLAIRKHCCLSLNNGSPSSPATDASQAAIYLMKQEIAAVHARFPELFLSCNICTLFIKTMHWLYPPG